MAEQRNLGTEFQKEIDRVEEYKFEPIKGYPMLHWKGKRPFESTQFYPAQLKETHGEEVEGWYNRIYWGDNLQVMSHLLKEFRGKINLIYIDPPFDSKADYKKKIQLRGKLFTNDQNTFEEKQYTDIWSNDEYLQFMYERLCLMRELLAEAGSVYVHCDWHKSHYLRLMMDEIFGADNFRNEIVWVRSTNPKGSQHEAQRFSQFTDTLMFYSKSSSTKFYLDRVRIPLTEEKILEKYHRKDEHGLFYDAPIVSTLGMGERPNLVYEYKGYTPGSAGWRMKKESLEKLDKEGNLGWSSSGNPFRKLRPKDDKGEPIGNFWNDISLINSQADERLGYPTQKPEKLLERILIASTDAQDIVLDCFMGSGTAQAVAMKLGRRFIGADINLGAIQTTTKRLISVAGELKESESNPTLNFGVDETRGTKIYKGFQVYNVNHYDFFRNELEAKDLLLKALEIQPVVNNSFYDGEKDGRMVKIMPVNRIATRADLNELITNFDQKTFERRQNENPNKPVEYLTLVCMGHEPDLAAQLQNEMKPFKIDVEVVDILRDKSKLELKRDSEAEIVKENNEVVIKQFYPMNLLQKLSLDKQNVEDWKELVESVMIDFNFDGAIFEPKLVDIPEKNELVSGEYKIPEDAGTIRVKITDLLSESLEMTIK